MPTNLTGIGTITYNGFTFAGPRVSSEISIRPVRDQANRTVMYTLYTLTVEAYVTADSLGQAGLGTDASAQTTALRVLLTKDGGKLVYDGLGHGNLEVNTTTANRDVNWGPKTQLVHFKPVGSIGCFEVVWTCEFALLECGVGVPSNGVTSGVPGYILGNFRSFNFGVEYGIALNGCTRRTISGNYEVILNRKSADPNSGDYNKIELTADDYREDISPTVPFGFKRESQSWRLSLDKARMEFTIIDTEMESDNSHPPGIAEIDVTHRIGTSKTAGNFNIVSCVIGGSVQMAKPYSLSYGWEKVLLIVKERIQFAKANNAGWVILDAIEISEHLFKRQFDFSVSYKLFNNPSASKDPSVVAQKTIQDFYKSTGVFAPLQSTNFVSWGNSLAPLTWSQRGVAGLAFDPNSDQIIDPCYQATASDTADSQRRIGSFLANGSLANSCPPKASSYVVWSNSVSLEWDGNTVVAPVTMPTDNQNPFPKNQDVNPGSSFPSSGNATPNFSPQPVKLSDGTSMGSPPLNEMNTAKVQASPNVGIWIVLRGGGMRLCYSCEIPSLSTSIDGTPTVYSSNNSKVEQKLVGYVNGIKVYSAVWELRYQLMANDLSALKDKDLDSLVMGTPDDQGGAKVK